MKRTILIHTMTQSTPEWWEIRRGKVTASGFDSVISDRGQKLHTERRHPTKKSASVTERLRFPCPKCGAEAMTQCCPYELKKDGSESYINRLIGDIADMTPNYFSSKGIVRGPHTERGRKMEPEARSWFEMESGKKVDLVGFIENEEEECGASPDGIIGLHPENLELIRTQEGTGHNYHGLERQVGSWSTFRYRVVGDEEGFELKCPEHGTQVGYLLNREDLIRKYKPQLHFSLVVSGFARWNLVAYCPGLEPIHHVATPDEYTKIVDRVRLEFMELYRPKMHKLCPFTAVVADWRQWLNNDPPLSDFNARLPTMAEYEYGTKSRVWSLVQAHAKKANLVFDSASKTYHTAEPVEEFF